MNLYFRLIAQRFSLRSLPQQHATESSRQCFRVWPSDAAFSIDHLTNSRVYSFVDLMRIRWLQQVGWYRVMKQHKILGVISAQQTSFYGMIPLLTRFEVETKLVYWDEKYAYFENRFTRKGKLCIMQLARIAFVDLRSKKPVRLDAMLDELELDVDPIKLPKHIASWQASLSHRY
ncbi:MAG: thioesterase family protein [Pseudomonadota bacterium]|nr:thioesterase family protein [Pseudomonadota bacterium]